MQKLKQEIEKRIKRIEESMKNRPDSVMRKGMIMAYKDVLEIIQSRERAP